MAKEFLDLYAQMMEADKKLVLAKKEYAEIKKKVIKGHEHEWFLLDNSPASYTCICPICNDAYRYIKRRDETPNCLKITWIPLYIAVMKRDIQQANEEIKRLREEGIAFICDMLKFSKMIEKYGYRLNVDTNEIEEIE